MKKTVGMGLSGRTEQFNRNFSPAPGGDKDGVEPVMNFLPGLR